MKKQQNNSTGASTLQVALSVALLSVSAVLLASSLRAASGDKDLVLAGPASFQSLFPADAPFTFNDTGSLNTTRYDHTATLLPNGKVLVAGGYGTGGINGILTSAELYDPASGTWSATSSLNTTRTYHTATLLPNGKVLVAGGYNGVTGFLTSAELYDPASGTWSATGSLTNPRYRHTATLLPNGKVLVAGGSPDGVNGLTSAELYDPASGMWSATGSLTTARQLHTATSLPNGKVLLAGGHNGVTGSLTSAELYDPASGTWSAAGSLTTARYGHMATLLPNGKVLVAGGFGIGNNALASAELYDPASGTWSATGSLTTARAYPTATLLPNGKVLVAGGDDGSVNPSANAELYDPTSGTWSATGSLNIARYFHTATLLPNGKVLVAAGAGTGGSSAELYDPASGSWTATGSLNTARQYYTATLLPNGKVLVAGGFNATLGVPAVALTTAELYDPATGTWTATGSLNTARKDHTATLLPNGKVLVAGGDDNIIDGITSAELYDPDTGTWTSTGNLNIARLLHTATLLPNGKVLVTGGERNGGLLSSAELYDPATGTWSVTGGLTTARRGPTATLLPNGKVLVAGGSGTSALLSSAELYDPATGTWTPTGSLNTVRFQHTATLLPTGKVLVAGGQDPNVALSSAELYDSATGTWTTTGNLNIARNDYTATLLPTGKVLVAGGYDDSGLLTSSELYDPASGTWTVTGNVTTGRYGHTATLLPNGKVLVAGGQGNVAILTSSELYDIGLGFMRPDWQPLIATATSPLITGSSLILTGSRFQGISEASGGNFQDSSSNYPVVQLRSIDNSQVAFVAVDPIAGWSDTSFTSMPVTNFPPGPALVTVFTNGIPSDSKYLVLVTTAPTPTPTPTPSATPTATPTPTPTPIPTATPTPTPTATATPTATPTPTPTPTVQVTVQTSPAGLAFAVDGTTYSSTRTFSWVPGSSHTIATTSPQSGGLKVQYVWTNWSGGGAISHTVTPAINTTYTATFRTQYYLTMLHGTGGTVTPASGWKNSGATVSINARPTNNTQVSYSFAGWTGAGTGSYSGTNNPVSIRMNGPTMEIADFTQNPVQVTVQTNPTGPTFSVDGTTYTSAQSFSWQPGSSHTIATTSPQSGGTGVQYVWTNWSGGGAISHTVTPAINTTYTATFRTQYYLTMAHGTGGTVTPASGWKNSGAAFSITARPSTGYSFSNWTGTGTGSFSGTANPVSITMGGPITENATFTHN